MASGCALYEFVDSMRPAKYLDYAYKDGDATKPKIDKGMSKKEVLALWGKPYYIENERLTTYSHKFTQCDELWMYERMLSYGDGFRGEGRKNEWWLAFKGDYLEVITEVYSHSGSNETLQPYADKKLKEQGLIP